MATIDQIIDDKGIVQGSLANRARSDDESLSLAGTGNPGETVNVYNSGTLMGEAVVGTDGSWSFEASGLQDGKNKFSVSSVDNNGVESSLSAAHSVTIDTSVGEALGLSITANNTASQVSIASGSTTEDNTPTISGAAERGATVAIFDDGVMIGEASTDSRGNWSMELALDLGSHNITVQVTDAAGNISQETSVAEFTVEMMSSAPDIAPTVNELSTNDTGAIITGTASLGAGDALTVTVNGVDYTEANGLVIDSANGSWSLDLADNTLDIGSHDISATVSNNAGSISDTSTNEISVEALVSSSPASSSAPAAAVASAGVVLPIGTIIIDGGLSNDSTPLIRGRATPGSEVEMSANGVNYGPVITPADGIWSIQVTVPLPEGLTQFSASATNAAGTAFFGYTLTIDTIAPDAPLIIRGADNVGSIQVDLKDGDHTDDDVPRIFGTGVPGEVIRVFENNQFLGTATADATTGEWSYTHTDSLGEGPHAFTALVIDDAGNRSETSNVFDLIIDRTAEVATITNVLDNEGGSSNIPSGGATDDQLPEIEGDGQAGATVKVFINGAAVGTTTVDDNGEWVFQTTTSLDPGNYSVTTTHTDLAGNTGGVSAPYTFDVVLNEGPVANADNFQVNKATVLDVLTNDTDADGDTLTVTQITQQPANGTVSVDASGIVTFTPANSTHQGTETFTYEVSDGNGGFDTATVTVEVFPALVAPTIDLAAASDSGRSSTDNITNITAPVLQGTATAGSTVEVYNGSTKLGETTADSAGNWSLTSSSLADGLYNLTAQSTSLNSSISSSPLAVTIDTVVNASVSLPAAQEAGSWFGNATNVRFVINTLEEVSYDIKDVNFHWGSRAWYNPGTSITASGSTSSSTTVAASYTSTYSHGWFTFQATLTDVAGNQTVNNLTEVVVDPIASLKDGGYIVTYLKLSEVAEQGFDVFAQRYDAQGNTVNGAFQVNSHTASDQINSDVTGLEDGGYLITWQSQDQDGSGYGIFAQRYDVDGNVVGQEIQVNTYTDSNQEKPEITSLQDGGYVITWMSEGQDGSQSGVYVRIYGADGNPVTGEVLVNATVDLDQANPTVTTLDNGNFVVSWQSNHSNGSDYDIFAQIYNPKGEVVKSEFILNSVSNNDQVSPNITNLASGGFATSWIDESADSTLTVSLRTFDALGNTVLDKEIQLNSANSVGGAKPEIAGLADGSFVITWAADDGDQLGIYASKYDADGNALFEEKIINQDVTGVQTEPHIVALEDGGYLITWADVQPQAGISSINGQQFDAQDQSVNGVFEVGVVADYGSDETAVNDGSNETQDSAAVETSQSGLENLIDDNSNVDLGQIVSNVKSSSVFLETDLSQDSVALDFSDIFAAYELSFIDSLTANISQASNISAPATASESYDMALEASPFVTDSALLIQELSEQTDHFAFL